MSFPFCEIEPAGWHHKSGGRFLFTPSIPKFSSNGVSFRWLHCENSMCDRPCSLCTVPMSSSINTIPLPRPYVCLPLPVYVFSLAKQTSYRSLWSFSISMPEINLVILCVWNILPLSKPYCFSFLHWFQNLPPSGGFKCDVMTSQPLFFIKMVVFKSTLLDFENTQESNRWLLPVPWTRHMKLDYKA